MVTKLLSIFKKTKPTLRSSAPVYVRPSEIGKTATAQPIEKIPIPRNNKPTILFMDDDYSIVEFTKEDINMMSSLAGLCDSMDKRYQPLCSSLSEEELKFLQTFDKNDYNFIYATTNTCGMAVEDAMKRGLVVDGAMLDIVLGGVSLEPDRTAKIIDGIDIAKYLKDANPDVVYKMYTACTLPEYSPESVKYKKLLKRSILDDSIFKGSDFNLKRREVLSILMHVGKKHDINTK